jgi:hypothetical protein
MKDFTADLKTSLYDPNSSSAISIHSHDPDGAMALLAIWLIDQMAMAYANAGCEYAEEGTKLRMGSELTPMGSI